MSEIITFLITVIAMTIGYLVGKKETLGIPEYAGKMRRKIIQSGIKPGPLPRPSIKQIDRKQNKSFYEGVDEVKKAFEKMGVKENG